MDVACSYPSLTSITDQQHVENDDDDEGAPAGRPSFAYARITCFQPLSLGRIIMSLPPNTNTQSNIFPTNSSTHYVTLSKHSAQPSCKASGSNFTPSQGFLAPLQMFQENWFFSLSLLVKKKVIRIETEGVSSCGEGGGKAEPDVESVKLPPHGRGKKTSKL